MLSSRPAVLDFVQRVLGHGDGALGVSDLGPAVALCALRVRERGPSVGREAIFELSEVGLVHVPCAAQGVDAEGEGFVRSDGSEGDVGPVVLQGVVDLADTVVAP